MIQKVYSYPGIAAGDILIKVGLAGFVRIPFAGGILDRKCSRPATYATSDPITQAIIENSPLFGSHIFLKDVYGQEEVVEEDISEKKDPIVYEDVTTFEEVVSILKSNYGVKAQSLRTSASVQKVANSLGIVFPNYNFD